MLTAASALGALFGDGCGVTLSKIGSVALFVGKRAVEIDRVDEVLFVAKSSSRVFHPLNLGVDGLAGSVGNRMGQVGNDVLESPLQHGGDLLHRL
jgi:hypothetical protein